MGLREGASKDVRRTCSFTSSFLVILLQSRDEISLVARERKTTLSKNLLQLRDLETIVFGHFDGFIKMKTAIKVRDEIGDKENKPGTLNDSNLVVVDGVVSMKSLLERVL